MGSWSSWTQDVSCKAIAATSHAHGLSAAPTARPSALSMMSSRMCTGKQPFVIFLNVCCHAIEDRLHFIVALGDCISELDIDWT